MPDFKLCVCVCVSNLLLDEAVHRENGFTLPVKPNADRDADRDNVYFRSWLRLVVLLEMVLP